MPPPDDGNEYLPFADLIRVERLDATTFRSAALPFSPGGQLKDAIPRAYGGHVYAQSAWAACQTVGEGFLIYNVVGYFHLPGSRTKPFIYKVKKIRDGRSYCTRDVTVTVEGETDACFTSTCSFKKPERNYLDLQENVDLWDKYSAALAGKKPTDFEEVPGMDVPWYWKLRKETGQNDKFPGLQSRKVDMTPYNKHRHPLDRRGLIFHRPIGVLPLDIPNLHLCAHLYASDRNSLYIVTNQMDVGDLWTYMSSLVHTTVFHGPMEDLFFRPSLSSSSAAGREKGPMDDVGEEGRWFAKEDLTLRASSGRAMLHGRLWAADGKHVATITQDGLIRYAKKPEATEEEERIIREREAGWPPRGKL